MIIHSRKKEMSSPFKRGKETAPVAQPIAEKPRYKVISVEEKEPEVKNEEVIEDNNIEE
jgi:hypothetical protein